MIMSPVASRRRQRSGSATAAVTLFAARSILRCTESAKARGASAASVVSIATETILRIENLLPELLIFPLLQRRRSLLFFYGFLDESDDLALFG